jgi:hypothetical protein
MLLLEESKNKFLKKTTLLLVFLCAFGVLMVQKLTAQIKTNYNLFTIITPKGITADEAATNGGLMPSISNGLTTVGKAPGFVKGMFD